MLDQLNIEPFVFFLGGTVQSDMMRYQVVPYPCEPTAARWLDGIGSISRSIRFPY